MRKTFYRETRKEVKDEMEKVLDDLENGQDISNTLSIVQLANEIRELKYNTNTIKRSSYIRIGETIDIIEKCLPFGNIPIQYVNRSIINSQSKVLTSYSQSIITKAWQQLQGAFNEARIREIVNVNSFDIKGYLIKPKSIKQTKKIDALTIDEENRFLKELDKGYDTYTIVFYIAIYTGMIDIPMINALYDKLLEYNMNKKRGFLFTKNGEFIHATNFNSRFQKLCKNADVRVYYKKMKIKGGRKTKTFYLCNVKKSDVNTHMLRHTFATRYIENGVNPVVLQKILGHKDIQVTLNTYTSVFNEFKENEIEKINAIF